MESTKIYEKAVSQIRRDPNQPRTIFNKEDIKNLSNSLDFDYKTGTAHKMINPIEIDKNGVIVTGEQRWRAAKLAGWKTVPVKIIDPGSADERFLRQVKENLGRGTMSPYDTRRAIERLAKMFGYPGKIKLSELCRIIGGSETQVSGYLDLQNDPKEIVEAFDQGKLTLTQTRALKLLSPELKETFLTMILTGKLPSHRGFIALVKAVERDPDKLEQIAQKDFSKMKDAEIIAFADHLAPTPLTQVIDNAEKVERVIRQIENVTKDLQNYSMVEVPVLYRPQLNVVMRKLVEEVSKFVMKDQKQLEKEVI